MSSRTGARGRKESLPSVTLYRKSKDGRTPFKGWELMVRRLFLRARSQPERATVALGAIFVLWLLVRMGSSSPQPHFVFSTSTSKLRASPRYVTYYHAEDSLIPIVQKLDFSMEHYPSKRRIKVPQDSLEAQKRLQNSREARRGRAETFETQECKAQYDWQLTSYPTCNTVYEYDLTDLHAEHREDERVRLISNGYWRDVWMVREPHTGTKRVVKTIRYAHDFVPRNYDRHRRDALAMERLTSSPYVVDIYGFCANSGIFEHSDQGDINDVIWPETNEENANNLTSLEKLRIATQVSMGLADTHNVDKEGQASIAHTDITPGQYILIDGWYKLNDFNRARFIRWNIEKNEPCGYIVGRNPGANRSPEEYAYDEQSEKVDVYSMGNIFYSLLTNIWPFEDISDKDAQTEVLEGRRPEVPKEIWESEDPTDMVLKEAMKRCHLQDPDKRATAREIELLLRGKMKELDPDTLEAWEKKYGRREYQKIN